jgi:MYXO-CTERM domain-containing protein
MLAVTALDLSSPGWSPAGGRRQETREIPTIHTPEPATFALLTLGALALRRRRRA